MERFKTIGVLSEFDFGLDSEYNKCLLEGYSNYNTAIEHMDAEALSYINELLFRDWEIEYTSFEISPFDGEHKFKICYRDDRGAYHTHCLILEFIDMFL